MRGPGLRMQIHESWLDGLIQAGPSFDVISHRGNNFGVCDGEVINHRLEQAVQTCCANLATVLAKKHGKNLNTFSVEFLIPFGE